MNDDVKNALQECIHADTNILLLHKSNSLTFVASNNNVKVSNNFTVKIFSFGIACSFGIA